MKHIGWFVLVWLVCLASCDKKPAEWKEYTRGTIVSVEYLQGGWSSEDKTVIRFKDGSVLILTGHESYVPAGKPVIVWKKGGNWEPNDWNVSIKVIKTKE